MIEKLTEDYIKYHCDEMGTGAIADKLNEVIEEVNSLRKLSHEDFKRTTELEADLAALRERLKWHEVYGRLSPESEVPPEPKKDQPQACECSCHDPLVKTLAPCANCRGNRFHKPEQPECAFCHNALNLDGLCGNVRCHNWKQRTTPEGHHEHDWEDGNQDWITDKPMTTYECSCGARLFEPKQSS